MSNKSKVLPGFQCGSPRTQSRFNSLFLIRFFGRLHVCKQANWRTRANQHKNILPWSNFNSDLVSTSVSSTFLYGDSLFSGDVLSSKLLISDVWLSIFYLICGSISITKHITSPNCQIGQIQSAVCHKLIFCFNHRYFIIMK